MISLPFYRLLQVSMRLTRNLLPLAPLALGLLVLSGNASANTPSTVKQEKKAGQQTSAKKVATPSSTAKHTDTAAKRTTSKLASANTAHRYKPAPTKVAKAVTEPKAPPPKPAISPEVVRKLSTLEETNKVLEGRVTELSQSLNALSQRHEDLKTRVDNPPPPPPMPKPEVPAGPLVVTGIVGALLGLLGSLVGGMAKLRFPLRARKEDTVPFPAPAEPMVMRQEPSVS